MTAPIPFAEYAAWPGVHWSTLAAMGTSPLAYHEAVTNPKPPSATMELGSAIHTAILEPELFEAEYAMYDGRKGTKAYAEWLEQQAADVTVLSVEQYAQCMGAAEAVWCKPQGREARRVLRGARREVSIRWTDPVTRIRCKARPDIVRFGRCSQGATIQQVAPTMLADVKTTSSVDARKFGKIAADLGYDGKMAFARMGLEVMPGGWYVDEVKIIAVEQKPPHDVAVFDVTEEVLGAGEAKVCEYLARLKTCRRRRSWPGRYTGSQPLDFPRYALPDDMGDEIEIISR